VTKYLDAMKSAVLQTKVREQHILEWDQDELLVVITQFVLLTFQL
jgi:hypothetical protein